MSSKKQAKYTSNKKSSQNVTIKAFNFENGSLAKICAKVKRFFGRSYKNIVKNVFLLFISLLLITAVTELHLTMNKLQTTDYELNILREKFDVALEAKRIKELAKMRELLYNGANATLEMIYTTDDTTAADIAVLARHVLARNLTHCNANTNHSTNINWCFRDINANFILDLEFKYCGNWIVTVGQFNHCLSKSNFGASHRTVFRLNDILFDISKYEAKVVVEVMEQEMRDNEDTDEWWNIEEL